MSIAKPDENKVEKMSLVLKRYARLRGYSYFYYSQYILLLKKDPVVLTCSYPSNIYSIQNVYQIVVWL